MVRELIHDVVEGLGEFGIVGGRVVVGGGVCQSVGDGRG